MPWPWKKRPNGPDLEETLTTWLRLHGIDPNEAIHKTVKRMQAMEKEKQERPQPPKSVPNINAGLILAIELLNRGALSVDLIHFGLRLRSLGDDWEIGPVPQHAIKRHADMFWALEAPDPPIAGDEVTDDTPEAPRVGAAPENA